MSDSEIDPSIRAAHSLIGLSASLYHAQTCLPAGYTGQHSPEENFIPTLLALLLLKE